MKRILVLTSDKNRAVHLRTLLEKLRVEFEIAIGEETARKVLSERYMNLIVLDVSAIKGGSCWIFPFLGRRRLMIPVLVLGADESILREPPPYPEGIRFLPPPFESHRLESALSEAQRWSPMLTRGRSDPGAIPLASATTAFEDF